MLLNPLENYSTTLAPLTQLTRGTICSKWADCVAAWLEPIPRPFIHLYKVWLVLLIVFPIALKIEILFSSSKLVHYINTVWNDSGLGLFQLSEIQRTVLPLHFPLTCSPSLPDETVHSSDITRSQELMKEIQERNAAYSGHTARQCINPVPDKGAD